MKKALVLLLALVLALPLAACREAEAPDTDPAGPVSTSLGSTDGDAESSPSEEAWAPLNVMDNKVLVSDYQSKRIIVYDLDLVGEDGDLTEAEIWSIDGYSASVKYREDTVFGNVVLHTAGYNASIVDYDTKELVWSAPGLAGWGVHSIEILPSGNVVTAGATDGIVRIFNSANGVNNGEKASYVDYPDLPGAHGVLWDPKYNCLWALGSNDLIAYSVVDNGDGTESLKKIYGMGNTLPAGGQDGHDLSADLTDSRYLWITSSKVYRYDKETGEFTIPKEGNGKLNKNGVKGFGNNLNKNFFYTQAKFDDKEWLNAGNEAYATDTIVYGYWKTENFLYLKNCVAEGAQFYKVRVFYGKYQ